MKKVLIVPALLLMLVACTPPLTQLGGQLPYRVWESWEEMKEVLGGHYLYPTYLPEFAVQSENPFLVSWYNDMGRELDADELFHGYSAEFRCVRQNASIFISATDFEKVNNNLIRPPFSDSAYETALPERERFNEHIATLNGIDISFFSVYGTFTFSARSPEEQSTYYHQNARIVHCAFKIDTVDYRISWVQYDVDDKYADDAQREGLLRVATSIIEQGSNFLEKYAKYCLTSVATKCTLA